MPDVGGPGRIRANLVGTNWLDESEPGHSITARVVGELSSILAGGEAIDVDSEAYFGNIAPGAFFVTKREGTAKSVQLIHNDGLSSTPRCLPDSDDARVPALTGDHHLFNLKLPPLYCCGVHGGLHTAASGRQETLAPHPGNGPLSRGHTCRAPRLSSCWAPRPAACNC